MDDEAKIARLEAYEDRTSVLMVVLAVVYLAVFAVQVLATSLPPAAEITLFWLGNLIWVTFVADLVTRTYLAPRKLTYLAKHPIDVLAVLVPAFRVLRVLRVITAGQWLIRRGSRLAVGREALAIVVAVTFLAFMGALAIFDVERGDPGANITTFGDALWWAAVTMSTVGYGDVFPVTFTGRLVAVCMMVVGIGLLGVVTASFASGLLNKLRGDEETEFARVMKKLDSLEAQVATLTEALAKREAAPSSDR